VSLRELLEEDKIELVPSSQERWVAVCPFHEGDRDPSFTVYPNETYYCFGCQQWGDAVKFLVDYRGMSDKAAREKVGEDVDIPKAEKKSVLKVTNALETYKLLDSCAKAYYWFLKQSPGAYRYLTSRGLSYATIDRYQIGYSDGRVLNLSTAWEYQIATEIGLITKSGQEAMSHRITIPNMVDSYCDFMIGRTVTNSKIKYLGTRMSKPIFGFWWVRHSPTIFLAEGQFDWLSLVDKRYPAAVLGGTHLTRTNLSLLRGKRIIIVPDNDSVGKNAAIALKNQIGAKTEILDYDELQIKDIGELAENSAGWKRFGEIVREQTGWVNTSTLKMT
jgi:DNA primase